MRTGILIYIGNCFLFKTEVLVVFGVIQTFALSLSAVLSLAYVCFFLSHKEFWYHNPDVGAIAIGFGKVLAKHAPKIIGGIAGSAVGFDQTYGSITEFQPSKEYGKVLRGEQTYKEFSSGFKNSLNAHFSRDKEG